MPPANTKRAFRFSCAGAEIPLAEEMLRLQGYEFEPDPFFAPARRLIPAQVLKA